MVAAAGRAVSSPISPNDAPRSIGGARLHVSGSARSFLNGELPATDHVERVGPVALTKTGWPARTSAA